MFSYLRMVLLRSWMHIERIQSTVFTALLFNRDFLSVISRRIQHQPERNMIISNLSVGSQSSQNDRSGNDKNEKYFVTHRDTAA